MRWIMILGLFGAARGGDPQNPVYEPPKLGQPADFSQIVGTFQIAGHAEPTAVAVEEPTTLTVTITGQAFSPYLPKRASLRIFPTTIDRDFFIEPISERTLDGAWEFVFRLRPKHERVSSIPGLKLVYYAPRQRRYQTAYSEAIPLVVTPRSAATETVPGLQVVSAPASFLELVPEPPSTFWFIPTWAIVAILLGAPAAFLAGLAWQRRRISPSDLWRRRAALEILRAIQQTSEPEVLCQTIGTYLRQLGYPAHEPTSQEVDRWLKRRGVGGPIRQRCRQVLADCAAARFGPERMADAALTTSCAEMIRTLEEQACLGER